MTIGNWIQVLIPVVSIVVAIASATLTYYFSKRKQILADESRLKEKFYLEYINALSNNVLSDNLDDSRSRLSEAHNNILLIGNADVVTKLRNFSDYIGPSNKERFNQKVHDELVTELVKSMRVDLYKNPKINVGYPTIGISGKKRRGE
ncbi:MAG: hypothetical protein VB099_18315 [Candidatus Limiplasma sp.]|nr:hypothetical protein [Candidatus Limiplasma sp.]